MTQKDFYTKDSHPFSLVCKSTEEGNENPEIYLLSLEGGFTIKTPVGKFKTSRMDQGITEERTLYTHISLESTNLVKMRPRL